MRTLGRTLATVIAVLGGLVLVAAPAHARPEPVPAPGSGASAALPASLPSPWNSPETYSAASPAPWLTAVLAAAVVVLALVVVLMLWSRRPQAVSPQSA